MRGLPRGRRVLATATALTLALAACGGDKDDKKPAAPGGDATGGTISYAISNPQHLVPTNAGESSGIEVLDSLFTGLIVYAEGTNEPKLSELAESIDSPDQQNFTIKIKPDWKFHNGEAVTAKSFVDAWNFGALNKNAQGNAYFFASIEGYGDVHPTDENEEDDVIPPAKSQTMSGLKVVSDTEFTVKLSAPDNVFRTSLGYTAFYPMPAAAMKDEASTKEYEKAPIGNGPFKMKGAWEPDKQIVVEKYADYKGTKPKIDGITYKIYQSLDTAWNELRAGTLDIMDSLPSGALASAPTELGDRYKTWPSSYYAFLGVPVYDEKYKNIKIRHAISRAIDRDAITKTVFQGTRVPADSFVNPVVAGYRKGICGDLCTLDPAAAKTLLQEGGGLKDMTITYNDDGGHKEWVEAACNQIKQNLGVECKPVAKPKFGDMLTDLEKAKQKKQSYGPFRLAWGMDYPSMQNYLAPLYGTGGSSNFYGYSNPTFDGLVKEGQMQSTDEAAVAKWQQAEDILLQEFPVIPLWFGVVNTARSENVENVKFDAFERLDKIAVTVKKK